MSIGLAILKIGEYSSRYDEMSQKVNDLQGQLIAMGIQAQQQGGQVQNPAGEQIRKELAIAQYLQGLFKDFLDYWKQVIKDTLGMLKSISELASGSR